MKKTSKPMIDADGEVRELTSQDFKQFRPADEVLPDSLKTKLGMRRRGPQKAPTKIPTSIRLSPSVIDAFKAMGDGWQGKIDDALKTFLREHPQG